VKKRRPATSGAAPHKKVPRRSFESIATNGEMTPLPGQELVPEPRKGYSTKEANEPPGITPRPEFSIGFGQLLGRIGVQEGQADQFITAQIPRIESLFRHVLMPPRSGARLPPPRRPRAERPRSLADSTPFDSAALC
jgi:hypothetical protein